MTRIVEEPDQFVEDALEGFSRVHSTTVRRVDGGIVRARPLGAGRVAVVVGGGSGHYPAFSGLVGEGIAAAAVCGNIFTSPSSGQAYRVAREAEAGGGVLFSYGNYAGDVLHFDEAQRRLAAEGIDTRTVLVTDDLASAPEGESTRRRGIAGDFIVFKIAGAAAEEGAPLEEVERLARKANDRTRTLGIAFGGCTLPGAKEPLFTVPVGSMSVGLGIHGEPGIRDEPMMTARDLAKALVRPLLGERPVGSAERVTVLLNGLGTVKYEELFVLYRYVTDELADAGLTVVEPECGELVTSLDMAGVSLTITWLDEELERLWAAPAATPAYRKGVALGPSDPLTSQPANPGAASSPARPASRLVSEPPPPAALVASATASRFVLLCRDLIAAEVDSLGRLDAVAGDGDHGIGMLRGLDAAWDYAVARSAEEGVATLLIGVGAAWSEKAGGTSGALWGAALDAMGNALGNRDSYDGALVMAAIRAASERVQQLGKARVGDKTMVDALVPFVDTLERGLDAGKAFPEALANAAAAAQDAARSTAALEPKLGRARPLAKKSVGHEDPGAVSFALMVSGIAFSVGSER